MGIRFKSGKIFFSKGIAFSDSCCCVNPLELDTNCCISLTFDANTVNCPENPCECASLLNGNTFVLTWNSGYVWVYETASLRIGTNSFSNPDRWTIGASCKHDIYWCACWSGIDFPTGWECLHTAANDAECADSAICGNGGTGTLEAVPCV